MKKRILVLLTVVVLMVVMLAISVAPAFARANCETDFTTLTNVCSGGEGGKGGGFGGHSVHNFGTADIVFSGNISGTGGVHCTGNFISGEEVCHGKGF